MAGLDRKSYTRYYYNSYEFDDWTGNSFWKYRLETQKKLLARFCWVTVIIINREIYTAENNKLYHSPPPVVVSKNLRVLGF